MILPFSNFRTGLLQNSRKNLFQEKEKNQRKKTIIKRHRKTGRETAERGLKKSLTDRDPDRNTNKYCIQEIGRGYLR